jgi:TolB protein
MLFFKNLQFILILSIMMIINTFSTNAQVRVVKNALSKNPSLKFNGIKGNVKLSNAILKDLKNCGWFDLTNNSNADYTLTGAANAGNLKITLNKQSPFLSFNMSFLPNNTTKVAHKSVDYILDKLFNVQNLCSSKIAFCASIAKKCKEIFVADYDGSNVKQLTHNSTLSVEPDWAPGFKRLLYTLYNRSSTDIIEYDLPSKRSRRLIHFPGLNTGGTVSPDGHYFAAILSKDGSVDLYVKSIETKLLKRLTKNRASESSPCWSPSGAKICFVSDIAGRPRLYVINASGKGMIKLKTFGTEAVSPDWSMDNKIVYSSKMGSSYTLAVYDMDTGESEIIVNAAGDWESPSWAPDSRHIIATRNYQGKQNLYIIDAWTKEAKGILGGKYKFSMPTW